MARLTPGGVAIWFMVFVRLAHQVGPATATAARAWPIDLQAGLDVREVQRLAGHRDLRTTQRYVDALRRSRRPVSSLLRRVFSDIRDELDNAA